MNLTCRVIFSDIFTANHDISNGFSAGCSPENLLSGPSKHVQVTCDDVVVINAKQLRCAHTTTQPPTHTLRGERGIVAT